MQEQIELVAERLVREKAGVVFSGAGISVESGIPDFRSPGGLWERYDIEEYATLDAFLRQPEKVWQMLAEVDHTVRQARPNPAHLAVAELEKLGVVEAVITQNIDGLHSAAGSRRVVEFHGSHQRMRCLDCGQSEPSDTVRERMDGEFPPRCRNCGRILKPDVVLFGEGIDEKVSAEAMRLAARCRTMLVVGTSGLVAPASYIPVVAAKMGALVVEINLTPTVLTSSVASISLFAPASQILPEIAHAVRRLMEEGKN